MDEELIELIRQGAQAHRDVRRPETIEELIDLIELGRGAVVAAMTLCIFPGGSEICVSDSKVMGPSRDGDGVTEERFANQLIRDFALKNGLDLLVPPDTYYRWTTRREEPVDAREGRLWRSINHLTSEPLSGLSVAEGPWLYFLEKPLCWFVAGRDICRGPDSEPILELSSLQPVGQIMTRRDVLMRLHDQNRERLAALSENTGVPEVELFALLAGLH